MLEGEERFDKKGWRDPAVHLADREIMMRIDGHYIEADPAVPVKPLIVPPPEGEVSDQDEKAWRRKLQAAEDSARKGESDG